MRYLNKSILKHEIRSMKWILVLSIVASLNLSLIFNMFLNEKYRDIFYHGLYGGQASIQSSLRQVSEMILLVFVVISIIQVFMQFRGEKGQEVGRFLKSLPVKNSDFFKVKLLTGIINLSLAFIILSIGMVVVRNSNMFWIKDVYSISVISQPFIKADSLVSMLGDIGLIYLVVVSFYTFLCMIQYTFSNIVGAIVTGIFVWLSPIFILFSSMETFDRIVQSSFNGSLSSLFYELGPNWLLPWLYPFDYNFDALVVGNFEIPGRIIPIADLGIKYIVVFVLILINLTVAYKLSKISKVEDENKVIAFKGFRNIFRFGVTICSALLVSIVLTDIIMIPLNNIIYVIFIILGGFIGYFVSKKIAQIGVR